MPFILFALTFFTFYPIIIRFKFSLSNLCKAYWQSVVVKKDILIVVCLTPFIQQ